jgi:hypothetical protein
MNPLHDDLIRSYHEDRRRAYVARRPSRTRTGRSGSPARFPLSVRFARIRPEETL